MADDDDVDDYMSDIYLTHDSNAESSRLPEYIRKRRMEEQQGQVKSRQNQMKSFKIIQREKREEALKKAIGSDNKGFKLMAKMGYKAGDGLGRNGIAIVNMRFMV